MKLAVIGSRTFNDWPFMVAELDKLYNIEEIVSGGAKGADSLAAHYARTRNIALKVFLPDWTIFGKRAGFIRNLSIVEYADNVIAFWDGESKGTKNSIEIAGLKKKPVLIRWPGTPE